MEKEGGARPGSRRSGNPEIDLFTRRAWVVDFHRSSRRDVPDVHLAQARVRSWQSHETHLSGHWNTQWIFSHVRRWLTRGTATRIGTARVATATGSGLFRFTRIAGSTVIRRRSGTARVCLGIRHGSFFRTVRGAAGGPGFGIGVRQLVVSGRRRKLLLRRTIRPLPRGSLFPRIIPIAVGAPPLLRGIHGSHFPIFRAAMSITVGRTPNRCVIGRVWRRRDTCTQHQKGARKGEKTDRELHSFVSFLFQLAPQIFVETVNLRNRSCNLKRYLITSSSRLTTSCLRMGPPLPQPEEERQVPRIVSLSMRSILTEKEKFVFSVPPGATPGQRDAPDRNSRTTSAAFGST